MTQETGIHTVERKKHSEAIVLKHQLEEGCVS